DGGAAAARACPSCGSPRGDPGAAPDPTSAGADASGGAARAARRESQGALKGRGHVPFPRGGDTSLQRRQIHNRDRYAMQGGAVVGGRVLLVEDDRDVRGAISDLLEGEGHTVISCANGKE